MLVIEFVQNLGTARVNVAVAILVFGIAIYIYILLIISDIRQVWGRLVQHIPDLQIHPVERLVGLCAVGIVVLRIPYDCFTRFSGLCLFCLRIGQYRGVSLL